MEEGDTPKNPHNSHTSVPGPQPLGEWSRFSSLDCKLCPWELFSKEFMLSYGFRATSGAKLKAAYSLTSLMVLWSGWPGDGRVWGCFTSHSDGLGFPFLKLSNCLNLNYTRGSSQECWQTRCRTQAFVHVLILCQAWFSLEVWAKPCKLMYDVPECDTFYQVTPMPSLG